MGKKHFTLWFYETLPIYSKPIINLGNYWQLSAFNYNKWNYQDPINCNPYHKVTQALKMLMLAFIVYLYDVLL